MRVGLIRHFPVTEPLPSGWVTAGDLMKWREDYDLAAVTTGAFDLGGVEWQACLCSDLSRAMTTAATVYRGEVLHTELLREAQFGCFPTGNLRLPVSVWKWLLRLCWTAGHPSQRAYRDEFRGRVLAAADRVVEMERDTLVVSHAGMMVYLSAELRKRGFTGPKLGFAKHAVVHLYERE